VFEEDGPAREPFYGGFGLLAPGGIKKSPYYAFELFHKLGTTRIANDAENVLVTRRNDGTYVIALWNLSPPTQPGKERTFDLGFVSGPRLKRLWISRVDDTHGNALAAYASLGKPRYPTEKQVQEMNRQSALPVAEKMDAKNGHLLVKVPVNGLVLLEGR
jgi:xylan 1,4-beta-xylosidase